MSDTTAAPAPETVPATTPAVAPEVAVPVEAEKPADAAAPTPAAAAPVAPEATGTAATTDTTAGKNGVEAAPVAAPVVEIKTKDSDSIKLFVGQIPRNYTAEMMLPFFEPYGTIFDWSLLVDRMTGLHKGCGFLTYKTRLSALAAMDALHDKLKIDGGNRPIQVKPADSEQGKVGGADEPENTKLFVGMLARNMDENGLRAMFSVYGTIEDAMILKNMDDGSSKGCGFVKYNLKASCITAINALNGQHTTEGNVQPLVVKFADTPREKAARRSAKMGNQQQWGAQAAGYGQNQWGQQGMGMYGQQQQQQYAQQYAQQGMYGQQYAQQAAQMGYGQQPGMGMYGQQAAQGAAGGYGGVAPAAGGDAQSAQYGPDGGNLFLYHLPNEWTDIDVITAFSPYGRVVSAKVFIDKTTGLSKCFGFVSYDNNVSAANAIQSMNGFQVAPGKRLRVQLKRPKDQSGGQGMGMGAGMQQYPQKPY